MDVVYDVVHVRNWYYIMPDKFICNQKFDEFSF